jgi:uncharacterized circularly permuted ATP-grasp superfamily protein/uncharacterized alpha-E superfamily protein
VLQRSTLYGVVLMKSSMGRTKGTRTCENSVPNSAPMQTDDDIAADWHARYCAIAPPGDAMLQKTNPAMWTTMLREVAAASGGDLALARGRIERQADEIGMGFRLPGDGDERKWPLSPIPLMIDADEWAKIADGVVQRATLMELLLADIYGPQRLTGGGLLPSAVINGSSHFLRPMVGLAPPGGHHLHFFAVDIGRGPNGNWRVVEDHTRTPTGAGYALENRLAVTRVLDGLQTQLHIARLAPFFADVRAGIAASCHRADPRIGLLTPGRYNQSYAEQAHIARYLGMLLVEGEDLAVHDDKLYLRTIEGLKRVDALWRRVDPRLLDPLAFDSRSRIGVPGLIDAMAAGNVVIANSPGAGVLESPAFAAFLPRLSVRLTGEDLRIPNIATWWCGQDSARDAVIAGFDNMAIGPAFRAAPRTLPDGPRLGASLTAVERAAVIADIGQRGIDYVGQEAVRLSTLPVAGPNGLEPRPFTVRVFATRDARGTWSVMPGGFARIGPSADIRAAMMGEGAFSTDVCIVGTSPVTPVSLVANGGDVAIRRNPGTLPSRVADNLFWLGRYLERAEGVLALIRASVGGSIDVDGGAPIAEQTLARLRGALVACGAATNRAGHRFNDIYALAKAALDDGTEQSSVRTLLQLARNIGEGSRERLSTDVWRLLDAPVPTDGRVAARAAQLHERFAALAGMSAENMGRTAGWRFLDCGRRIERAVGTCRLLKTFGGPGASADDLSMLLELASAQIGYRQRYPIGLAAAAVTDLVALDDGNPRSVVFQVNAIARHLEALPRLADDGMAEPQQVAATALAANISTLAAATLDDDAVQGIENRLQALSDAIGGRFFLRGGAPLRAAGMTLA